MPRKRSPRTHTIAVKVTRVQDASLRAKAAAEGVSVSSLLYPMLVKLVPPRELDIDEV